MFCSECGKKLEKNQKFCSSCGAKAEIKEEKKKDVFCSECGKKLKAGETFCGECGHKNEVITASVEEPKKEVKKERKKVSKKTIIVIAILIVLVGSYLTISTLAKPEKVVEAYCKDLTNGKYGEIFKKIDFPKSDFLTEEKFKQMASEEGFTIDKCEVKDLAEDEASSKRYNVTYTSDDNEADVVIEIVKTDKKKFLLFDDWRMVGETMYTKEWKINTPIGSKLFIDGKEVTNKDDATTSKDVFIVENVFETEYEVKVTHPFMEEYKENIVPSYSTNVTSEVKEDLDVKIDDLIIGLYDVALLNKDYSTVEDLINADYKTDAERLITNMKSTVEDAISWVYDVEEFRNIEITDLVISDTSIVGTSEIKLKATYNIAYDYKLENSEEFVNKKSKYYLTLGLEYSNDKWILVKKY